VRPRRQLPDSLDARFTRTHRVRTETANLQSPISKTRDWRLATPMTRRARFRCASTPPPRRW
jgi:hypothetical protein